MIYNLGLYLHIPTENHHRVLTAAHVVHPAVPGNVPHTRLQIVLGGYDFPPLYQSRPNTNESVLGVDRIVYHPETGLIFYDIALLKLNESVPFGPKIFPACVPGPDYKIRTNKMVTATGWGLTDSVNDI